VRKSLFLHLPYTGSIVYYEASIYQFSRKRPAKINGLLHQKGGAQTTLNFKTTQENVWFGVKIFS
jgi:hypothetical protein